MPARFGIVVLHSGRPPVAECHLRRLDLPRRVGAVIRAGPFIGRARRRDPIRLCSTDGRRCWNSCRRGCRFRRCRRSSPSRRESLRDRCCPSLCRYPNGANYRPGRRSPRPRWAHLPEDMRPRHQHLPRGGGSLGPRFLSCEWQRHADACGLHSCMPMPRGGTASNNACKFTLAVLFVLDVRTQSVDGLVPALRQRREVVTRIGERFGFDPPDTFPALAFTAHQAHRLQATAGVWSPLGGSPEPPL